MKIGKKETKTISERFQKLKDISPSTEAITTTTSES